MSGNPLTIAAFALFAALPAAAQTDWPLTARMRNDITICVNADRGWAMPSAVKSCDALLASGLATQSERSALYRFRGFTKVDLKDWRGALADFDKALTEATTPQAKAEALYSRLSLAAPLKWSDERMMTELDEVIKDDPTLAEAWRNRAILRTEAGRNREALADLDQAIALDPNDVAALYAACWSRAADLNIELDRARSQCDAVVRLWPKEANAYTGRAIVSLRQQRWQAAYDDFSASIRLNPTAAAAAAAFYGRAVAAARLGMIDLAAEDLAKARALSKTVEADYAKLGLKP